MPYRNTYSAHSKNIDAKHINRSHLRLDSTRLNRTWTITSFFSLYWTYLFFSHFFITLYSSIKKKKKKQSIRKNFICFCKCTVHSFGPFFNFRLRQKQKTINQFIRSWIHWMHNATSNETMRFAWANWKMRNQLIVMYCMRNPMWRSFCRSVSICIASRNCSSRTHTIVSWVRLSMAIYGYGHSISFIYFIFFSFYSSCTHRRSRHLTDWRNLIFITAGTTVIAIRRNQSWTILQRW